MKVKVGSSGGVSTQGTVRPSGTYAGEFNPASGIPTTGTGRNGAILKGDFWQATGAGTIAGLEPFTVFAAGDLIYADKNNAQGAGDFFGNKGTGGGSFTLTNGSGTTANGTAVDLGGTLTDDATITGAHNIFFGTFGSRIAGFFAKIADTTESARQVSVDYGANAFAQGLSVTAQSFGDSTSYSFLTDRLEIIPSGTFTYRLNFGSDATGDTYYRNSSGYLTRLAVGTDGNVLTLASGVPSWAAPSGGAGSLSALTAATGSNTINNVANAQEWQWNSLTSGTGFLLSSSSTAAASNTQRLFRVNQTGANATSSQVTYAVSFNNTKTGTGAFNIAIEAEASGGLTNYAMYVRGGGINLPNGQFIGWADGLADRGISVTTNVMKISTFADITFFNSTSSVYTEKMRLTASDGNLVIGHTAASARLHVRGSGTGTSATFLLEDSSGTDRFSVLDNGGIFMLSLPTSAAGLTTGQLWNNLGVINIV